MPGSERKRILHRVADLIVERAQQIALTECVDTGQTVRFMSAAALHGIEWSDHLQPMRDGIARHGPVREGVYAMVGYEGTETHAARLGADQRGVRRDFLDRWCRNDREALCGYDFVVRRDPEVTAPTCRAVRWRRTSGGLCLRVLCAHRLSA